jgi:hypothetical protein
VKELNYAGSKTIVSDQLADALTDYAQALAATGASDVIDIPSVGEDGTIGRSRLLLGPASQIIAEPVTVDASSVYDLDDADAIAELKRRIRNAGAQHALPLDADDTSTDDFAL